MGNLEKKSDMVVGLNHMANILGPLIIYGLLVNIVLGNVLPMVVDKETGQLLQNLILFTILLVYIYKAGKYINGKFEYINSKKVVLSSVISFFVINFLYIVGMIFFLSSISSNQIDKSTFDFFLEITGFNNIISIIIYILFYSLYYVLSLKGLKKDVN